MTTHRTLSCLLWCLAIVFTTACAAQSVTTVQETQAARGGTPKYWHVATGYGSDGQMMWTYVNGGSRDNWMVWSSGLPGGRYAVQVFVPRMYATTKNAVYHIRDGGRDIATKAVNQRAYDDVWVELGVYNFCAEPSVLLGDDTGEKTSTKRQVGFDGVKFVPLGVADPAVQAAIEKARSYLGKIWGYDGPGGKPGLWCLNFVGVVCGARKRFGSAQEAANYFTKQGKMHTGGRPSQAPLGAWVFFRWNPYGHVGMMSGPGRLIHQNAFKNGKGGGPGNGEIAECNPDGIPSNTLVGWPFTTR